MKVYCVSGGVDDEFDTGPLAVFTTKDKADQYVQEQKADPDFDAEGGWFEVTEHDLDNPTKETE
jgi:hypothetical protein